jgi:uncharacterized protein
VRIEVENLTAAGEPFAHTYAEGELSLDEGRARLAGETRVEGRASRKGDVIRLAGRISANVEVSCDRCLQAVRTPTEVEFEESFTPPEEASRPDTERELQRDDLHVSFYEGDAIDLGDLVREQLLLALPGRFVCREDCKGLCPTCGADLNAERCDCAQEETDPRWAALGKLKSRES